MVSFDLSAEMIEYAEKHNPSKSIDYKKSDLSADWDNLHHDLKHESSADLVFSIHCLHWISESLHHKSVANIRNMLKPGNYRGCFNHSSQNVCRWVDLLGLILVE